MSDFELTEQLVGEPMELRGICVCVCVFSYYFSILLKQLIEQKSDYFGVSTSCISLLLLKSPVTQSPRPVHTSQSLCSLTFL